MPQIGAAPIPLKSPQGFLGLTTLSKSAPFQYLELENGYVSSDAGEIRMMPGYVPVVDPASAVRGWSTNQPFGFIANHFAARRGGITAASGYNFEGAPTQNQHVWTRPTQIHCIEQVGGRWIIVGQSDHQREPIFDAGSGFFVKVISYDDVGGTQVALTLDANPLGGTDTFNAVIANDRIALEGLTGAGAALLNSKGHNVVSVVGAVVTINTNIGAIANQTGQTGYIDRVTNNGQGSGGSTDLSDDKESLTIWTCREGGSVSSAPAQTMFPAHVFNRQRDFGDGNFIKQGNRNPATVNGGRSRRRQKPLPYRLVPHIAGNRLILAAPGYGCVFQAPAVIPSNFDESSATFGVNSLCNDIYDQPRCLGVPKAVMWEDPDKTVAATAHIWTGATTDESFGGSAGAVTARSGTYKFKVAYRDEGTGEIGLCSEPITVTTDAVFAANEGIQLFVYFPGYLMHESGALNINLYRTALNGDTFFFDGTAVTSLFLHSGGPSGPATSKYGVAPENATTEYFHHVVIRPKWRSDASLATALGRVPDVLEQMPMGCKAARTIRGFTLFGGALGDAGPRQELKKGTLSMRYDNVGAPNNGLGRFNDRIMSAFTNDWAGPVYGPASFEGAEEGFGCSARIIPPAYAGQTVVAKWFPFPRKQLQLNKLENTDMAYDGSFPNDFSGRIQDVRYSILDTPIRPEVDLSTSNAQLQVTHMRLPRAQTQISEPDNPGVTPATNTTVFAALRDDDIEAIGDAGGQAIVCTRGATYTIASSQSPVDVPPDIASDGFGCIAPNSMVTFDGGCAWLSERGPCAWSGGVQFIGESMEKHFSGETARYLRDTTGMMRHSWACHDPERKLIYFGVFAGRAGTSVTGSTPNPLTVNFRGASLNWVLAGAATEDSLPAGDKARSLFPCDEVLVYSYRTGAWSFWRPPLTMGILWMARGIDSAGTARVFFAGTDNRLYALGDEYGQGDRESFKTTVVDNGTVSVLTGFTASVMSRVGLTVAIYSEDATTGQATLKALTTVTVDSGTSITLAAPVAVVPGDIALVGARTMRVDTTFFNMKRTETTRAVKGGLRFQLWSRFGNGVGGSKQQAFVSASVKTELPNDGVPTTKENSLTTEAGALTPYRWIGQDLPDDAVHEFGLKLGSGSGANHQLKFTFVGGAQVRLHDIYTEVQ